MNGVFPNAGDASFNPRAREGRDSPRRYASTASARFNPRAREGRDRCPNRRRMRRTRFNPRAREGRDVLLHIIGKSRSCFNPRAREGRDTAYAIYFQGLSVSIHAPARGATRGLFDGARDDAFQSTRPRGARPVFM